MKIKKREIKKIILIWILQKILGLVIIIGTILIGLSGLFCDPVTGINDCTGLIIFMIIGILLLVSNEIIFIK